MVTQLLLKWNGYQFQLEQNELADMFIGIADGTKDESNRQSRQRLDRHGTIVVGSCETFHHYNVQGVK